MKCRAIQVLFLLAASGFAQNLPRFTFSIPTSDLGPVAVAVDAHGNSYVTGSVLGSPFAATPGAYQSQNNGGNTCVFGIEGGFGPPLLGACANAFVVKLDRSGAVVFATYLGGTGDPQVVGMAVDSEGGVYVAGNVEYGDFPVTPGAAFTTATGAGIGFIAKLNASGSQLAYSTLIPGAFLRSIAVDGAGEAYFTGSWGASYAPFPTTHGAFQMFPGNTSGSAIVGELNASGSALVYGTYIGGTQGPSGGAAIAMDAAGNALIAGYTAAADFPATSGTFSTEPQGTVFLAKLSADGSALIYASLLGPASIDTMKLSASGDAYIECYAAVSTFPATGGFGVPPSGATGSFLLHVGPNGSSVRNAVYLPFVPTGLDVDSAGNAYLLGEGPVPTTEGAFESSANDTENSVAIAKIAPDGQILGATYQGVTAANSAGGIAVERDGSVAVAGLIDTSVSQGAIALLVENFFPAVTIENSASYVANTAVAGEEIAIQGYGLGPATGVVSAQVNSLGGVQVYFDSFSAPIIYAQANQINVQVPWEIAGQTSTQVRIVYNGVEAGSVTVPVGDALPGVFYITNADGSFNSASNPAHAGDLVSIFGTGGGAMNPPGVTGQSWPLAPLSFLTQTVSVTVAGEAAAVAYAGSAPTLDSGFFQINLRLPADLTSAARSLCVVIGGVSSAPVPISIE